MNVNLDTCSLPGIKVVSVRIITGSLLRAFLATGWLPQPDSAESTLGTVFPHIKFPTMTSTTTILVSTGRIECERFLHVGHVDALLPPQAVSYTREHGAPMSPSPQSRSRQGRAQ
jgi:hypothetical protein